VLFYNALAKALNIDLDRLNISILSVEGLGFKLYVDVWNGNIKLIRLLLLPI